jgi:hypothetical protein
LWRAPPCLGRLVETGYEKRYDCGHLSRGLVAGGQSLLVEHEMRYEHDRPQIDKTQQFLLVENGHGKRYELGKQHGRDAWYEP